MSNKYKTNVKKESSANLLHYIKVRKLAIEEVGKNGSAAYKGRQIDSQDIAEFEATIEEYEKELERREEEKVNGRN